MKFSCNNKALSTQKTDCIILGVYEKGKCSDSATAIDKASKQYLSKLIKSGDFSGDFGEALLSHHVPGIKAERVLLIGLGNKKQLDASRYQTAIKHAAKQVLATNSKHVINCLVEAAVDKRDSAWRIRQAIICHQDIAYQYNTTKSKKDRAHRLKEMQFNAASAKANTQAITRGKAIATGMALCKDLGNLPSNICTPSYLAKQALVLAKTFKSIHSKSLNEAEMKKLGMGALLSVSKGSVQPAKLIVMEYKGTSKKGQQPIALVGKGITFDTGGISIKPRTNLDEMKFDMCGAASVFGTMHAIAEMKLPINVVGIVASAENMPGGSASKPGDIVKTMSGQTVEILDTDAEGRLVLCDALTYASRYKPKAVLDMATLTGAMVVALGHDVTGFFSNSNDLSNDLKQAANVSNDHAWEMPLWRPYDEQLNSRFADFANIGTRWGGAITAACFLAKFTDGYKWAHLDVAGSAHLSGAQKGATARPVPLLTQYLIDQC